MNKELIGNIETIIKKVPAIELYRGNDQKKLLDMLNRIHDWLSVEPELERNKIIDIILPSIAQAPLYNRIYIYTMLAYLTDVNQFVNYLADICLDQDSLHIFEVQYLLKQLMADKFINNWNFEYSVFKKLYQTYSKISEWYCNQYRMYCTPIPKEERNSNNIVLLTGQLLAYNHAPSKVAIDYCKFFVQYAKKNVILINCASDTNNLGKLPFYSNAKASFIAKYSDLDILKIEDLYIHFYQFKNQKLDFDDIQTALSIVRKEKPYLILSIGDMNVVADICNQIAPVITFVLSSDDTPMTRTQFLFTPIHPDDHNEEILNILTNSKEGIINSDIIYDIPKQYSHCSRYDFGLPEDAFIIAVVSNRLDREVSADFLNMMLEIRHRANIFVVFVGLCTINVDYEPPIEGLSKFSKSIGYHWDLPALMQICDLYVNPKRRGGGTSALIALAQGVPVVTENYGDVATNVGHEFIVDDMMEAILRYVSDKDYYEAQSKIAIENMNVLNNWTSKFQELINIVTENPLFW